MNFISQQWKRMGIAYNKVILKTKSANLYRKHSGEGEAPQGGGSHASTFHWLG